MIPRRSILTTCWKGGRSVFIYGSNGNALPACNAEDASSSSPSPSSSGGEAAAAAAAAAPGPREISPSGERRDRFRGARPPAPFSCHETTNTKIRPPLPPSHPATNPGQPADKQSGVLDKATAQGSKSLGEAPQPRPAGLKELTGREPVLAWPQAPLGFPHSPHSPDTKLAAAAAAAVPVCPPKHQASFLPPVTASAASPPLTPRDSNPLSTYPRETAARPSLPVVAAAASSLSSLAQPYHPQPQAVVTPPAAFRKTFCELPEVVRYQQAQERAHRANIRSLEVLSLHERSTNDRPPNPPQLVPFQLHHPPLPANHLQTPVLSPIPAMQIPNGCRPGLPLPPPQPHGPRSSGIAIPWRGFSSAPAQHSSQRLCTAGGSAAADVTLSAQQGLAAALGPLAAANGTLPPFFCRSTEGAQKQQHLISLSNMHAMPAGATSPRPHLPTAPGWFQPLIPDLGTTTAADGGQVVEHHDRSHVGGGGSAASVGVYGHSSVAEQDKESEGEQGWAPTTAPKPFGLGYKKWDIDTSAFKQEIAETCQVLKRVPKGQPLDVAGVASLLQGRVNNNRPFRQFEICQVLKAVQELRLVMPFFRWCQAQPWYSPDVFVYTTLIGLAGYERDGSAINALYTEMRAHKLRPTRVTFNRLIHGYGRVGMVERAASAFEEAAHMTGGNDSVTYHTLLDVYTKAGKVQEVENMLQAMKSRGFPFTNITYSLLIGMYCRTEEMGKAEKHFSEMKRAGVKPNAVVYNIMINLYGRVGRHDLVFQALGEMMNAGLDPDLLTYTTLMSHFGKAGKAEEAEKVFQLYMAKGGRSDTPDHIAYTTMLHAYLVAGHIDRAVAFFQHMVEAGMKPKAATFNVFMAFFLRERNFPKLLQVFSSMADSGLVPCLTAFTLFLTSTHQPPLSSTEFGDTIISLLRQAHPRAYTLLQTLYSPASSSSSSSSSVTVAAAATESAPFPAALHHHTFRPIPSPPLRQRQLQGPVAPLSASGLGMEMEMEGARETSPTLVSAMVSEILANQDVEAQRAFLDSLTNFLTASGKDVAAGRVWTEAVARPQLFPHFIHQTPTTLQFDFHHMSAGTCRVATVLALTDIREQFLNGQLHPPQQVIMVTGWGKRSRVPGASTVRQTVADTLFALNSPFKFSARNSGKLFADGESCYNWLIRPEMEELLTLKDAQ